MSRSSPTASRSLLAASVVAAVLATAVPSGASTPHRTGLVTSSRASSTATGGQVRIASISSSTLNRDEVTTVTISGSGFVPGASVGLGAGVTASALAVRPTSITAKVAVSNSAPHGTRTLTVTNPGGGQGSLKDAVHVDYGAVFTKWAVGDGAVGWKTTLSRPSFSAVPTVTFTGGGVTASSESIDAAHQLVVGLTVDPRAPATWRDMTITLGSSTWSAPRGLKVRRAPIVTSVTPLPQGATNREATVKGFNFEVCADKPPVVTISGAGVTVVQVSSALGTVMYLHLTVAANATPGPRDVSVTNCDSGGTATSRGVFTVIGPPTVTAIPAIAVGVTRKEFVSGSGFVSGTTLTASGTGVTFSGITYVSATRLIAQISVAPSAALGPRDVTAANPGGKMSTSTGVLSIDALPTLSTVSPATLTAPGTQTETLSGAGFQKGAAVTVGSGTAALPHLGVGQATVVSPGELRVSVRALASVPPGSYDVTVLNPDGGSVGAVGALAVVVQLARPVIVRVASSTTTAGAIRVLFAGSANAPPAQSYAATACRNAAMTAGCVTTGSFVPGQSITGLAPGAGYFVTVSALASAGYLASRSAVAGPARATTRLGAPGTPVLGYGRAPGSLSVAFARTPNAPRAQRYSLRACTNAAMTTRCAARSGVVPGSTLSGLAFTRGVAGARYFVEVWATAAPGYLSSAPSGVSSHADTSELAAPRIIAAGSPAVGRIRVSFRAGAGVRPSSYTAEACTNAAMTSGCVRESGVTSGGALGGLVPGRRYFVAVIAMPPVGFTRGTSAVAGPVTVR